MNVNTGHDAVCFRCKFSYAFRKDSCLQETRVSGASNLLYHKAQPNEFSIVMSEVV